MPQLLTKTTRSLRIALVLLVVAAGFATHAFASTGEVVVTDFVAVDQRNMPVAGYLGNMDAPELVPATYVDKGNGKVTTTYEISYTNILPHPYQFRIAMYMLFDPTITIDNYTVTAQGNAPTFDPAPVGGGGGGIQRVYKNGNGYSSPGMNKNQINIIPPNTTYTYLVKIDSTESSATTAESTKCIRVNNRDNGTGSYNYARGGRELAAWVDIFESRNAAGQPIPDRMGMSLDAVASGCADTANVVAAPVTTTPATQPPATTPATAPATTPATSPVTVPETIPHATNATLPQYNGDLGVGQADNGSLNHNLNDVPATVPVADGINQGVTETPGASTNNGTPALNVDDVPVAQSGTDVPAEASPDFLSELVENSSSYSAMPASPTEASRTPTEKEISDAMEMILDPKPVTSDSSSQNVQYAIAGLLVLGALTALAAGKKLGRPGMVVQSRDPGKETRVSLSAAIEQDIPMDASSHARLYNSHMTFVDIEDIDVQERELELVGAGSISSGASAAQRRTSNFDATLDDRKALPSRIWNELVSRLSREHHTIHNHTRK